MKCNRVCTTFLTVALLVLAVLAGWTALKSMRMAQLKTNPTVARAAGKPMPVSTVAVATGSLESLAGAECVAKESSRVALATEFDYRVARLETAVGMQVDKNQLLVKFEDATAKEELANAKQGQTAARSLVNDLEPFLADVRKLEQKRLISIVDKLQVMRDLGQARIDLVRASKDVITADKLIDKSEVRAPFAGVVTVLNVEVGSTPQPFTELLVISRLNPIQLECGFAETDIETVTSHDRLEASFTAYPGRVFPAEFYRLLPVVNDDTHTLSVLLRLENDERAFLPGMQAIGRIAKRLEGLRVPAISLIKPDRDKASVFVVDEAGRAHLREVGIGRYAQGYVQIKQGLEAGERVVVAGQLYLQDGDTVREDERTQDERNQLFPIRDR